MNNNTKNRFFSKPTTLTLCITGIMIALEIVLERFLPILNSGYLKINFAFVPMAVVAMLYGPLYSGAAWAITDLIGALLFPTGAYFPGFTLNQLLSGLIFGFLLYNIHDTEIGTVKKIIRILIAVILKNFVIGLLLGTLWLTILFGDGYLSLLPLRITGCLINFGIETVTLVFLSIILEKNRKSLGRLIKNTDNH